MFTYTQIEEQLKKSGWPDESVQVLLPVLPQLGRWALSYLYQQLNATGSATTAAETARVLSQEPIWYKALQSNQTSDIAQFVHTAVDSDSESMQRAVLANILDIRSNNALAEVVSRDLSELFDELEIKYLIDLPIGEIVILLNSRISHMIATTDLPMEIKRLCYYRDNLEAINPEVIRLRQAVESNSQLIGADPKSVKDWIKDFLQSAATSKDRSAYNVAFYVTNSPAAQKLGDRERAALSDILKLYNWLLAPHTTEGEIQSYEEQRLVKKNEAPQASVAEPPPAPERQVSSAPRPVAPPEPEPTPQPTAEQRRVIEDIKRAQHKPVTYNAEGAAVAPSRTPASIYELINHKKTDQRGVTMDPTNVKIADEQKRMAEERTKKETEIQRKLAELRQRNTSPNTNTKQNV